MSNSIKPQILKGFRDFLPPQMNIRQRVINVMRKVFESYGFEPLETPTLEYASTLLGKYGEEADKLVYTFKDRGEREVGLIYDLTVPTAKVLATYQNEIPLPFKRYQIQRVWRADKPQKGRYREILQCDVDIFGVNNEMADAEIIAIINTLLQKLSFKQFTIKVNSRKVLFDILARAGITDKTLQEKTLQSIDKLDKKSKEEVIEELKERSLDVNQISKLFELLDSAIPDENLQKILSSAEDMGVLMKIEGKSGYRFTPYMVRGLSYYTGSIFETVVEEPKIGSITGGGRYDKLIELLGGPDIPAVGTTIGLDRICDVMEALGIDLNDKIDANVLVAVFPGYEGKAAKFASQLRNNDIATELYLKNDDISKQLKYADKKGVSYIILLGPDEVKNNMATLKNLKTGEQETTTIKQLIDRLKPLSS